MRKWNQRFLCLIFLERLAVSLAHAQPNSYTVYLPHRLEFLYIVRKLSVCLMLWRRRHFVLEDLRTVAPVLSFFGLPVAAFIDKGAFSRLICPLLKPQWLVTLNVLP